MDSRVPAAAATLTDLWQVLRCEHCVTARENQRFLRSFEKIATRGEAQKYFEPCEHDKYSYRFLILPDFIYLIFLSLNIPYVSYTYFCIGL